ncbi:sigma factor-like helix-turn-helix DNA-binding protein [Streptomyces sp. NPDC059875]|uniref:sigma factor-like helix-turn-helix DNA-binding protein n=1 Tax=unclassified Streptomyces TaxID=2593676 RepID=UPI00364C6EA8
MVDHALNPDDHASLTDRFEEQRPRLRAVAYRMLGSAGEADEAVREARLRLGDAGSDADARSGFGSGPDSRSEDMTLAVARVCLDMLRSRESRRADPWDPWGAGEPGQVTDPEERALLAVLDTLTPVERLAFVLHDMFTVPLEEIAPIVERTPSAARQLAARARRRVQGTEEMPEPDLPRQRQVVAAFLAASRSGDVDALLALLDPDVVLRADEAAVRAGAGTAHGARAVAESFAGRIGPAARLALVDGAAGLVEAPSGPPTSVIAFTVLDGHVTAVDTLRDPGHLDRLDVKILPE